MINFFKSLLNQLESDSLEEYMDDIKVADNLYAGINLTEEKVETLEQELEKDAERIETRASLLGYYSSKRLEDENCNNAFERHVLWVIENVPGHKLASTSAAHLYPSDSAYKIGKDLWLKQVEANKSDLAILENAFNYVVLKDIILAESLLQRARKIDSLNPKWSNKLSLMYSRKGCNSPEYRRNALEEKKVAYKKARLFGFRDGLNELIHLPYLARIAGDNNQAASYAAILLSKARNTRDKNKKAKCTHEGKNVLGLLEFDKGNYEAATVLLMESVDFRREELYDLNPRVTLAKLLIEKGFISEVSRFAYKFTERFGEEVLQRWQLMIRAGEMPEDW